MLPVGHTDGGDLSVTVRGLQIRARVLYVDVFRIAGSWDANAACIHGAVQESVDTPL